MATSNEPTVLIVRKVSCGPTVYKWLPETLAASWVQRSGKQWRYATVADREAYKQRNPEEAEQAATAG
jgi:hypothetical protein